MTNQKETKKLTWWQLSLVGIGSIIGTGYFLGSSIAIKQAGPSVILLYLLASIGTYIVFQAMARMTAEHPEKGSFRTYAKKAFGKWAGFSIGWVYWSSEMLIMGSQLTALGVFSKFWFPDLPLWIFAAIYGILGMIVILTGVNGFEKAENVFAVVKVAAIFMFILIAALGAFGVLNGEKIGVEVSFQRDIWLPEGFTGLWSAFIYAFYAFAGIEVMGIMASELKDPKEAPRSGRVMLIGLAIIYMTSIALAILLVNWDKFTPDKSPFIKALDQYNLPIVPDVLNGALIIAGFSTMTASLYAITTMIVVLAKDGDAPPLFQKTGKRDIPFRAATLTFSGMALSIIVSFLLPEKIYEYITTAAGLMILYTWIMILFSFKKLSKLTSFDQMKRWLALVLILIGISGTVVDQAGRPGFFVSISFLLVIFIVTFIMSKRWKKEQFIK
ncbi:amino acid permease [Bacillaceae bacterium S4-13-56]